MAAAATPSLFIAESIPQQTEKALPVVAKTTYDSWMDLIQGAQECLYIGQYYWSLGDGASYAPDGGWQGKNVLDAIVAAKKRGVDVRIVRNAPGAETVGNDEAVLRAAGVLIETLNFTELGLEAGIFHTKMLVADHKHVYVGSANSDWRSLTQVKEAGVVVLDSKEFAADAERIFGGAWLAAQAHKLPRPWPDEYRALYTAEHPLVLKNVNGVPGNTAAVYIALSPDTFCAGQRTSALTSTLDAISAAQHTIDIEVMDYKPATAYLKHNVYWDTLDAALRAAAFEGKHVRLLIGHWNHTSPSVVPYLMSLNSLDNIEVRWFVVPDLVGRPQPPFSRVNHAKFLVTDKTAYISTNNWYADYFLYTHGLNVIVHNARFRSSLQTLFDRDWSSPYTRNLDQVKL